MQRAALPLLLAVSGCVAHAASDDDRLILKDGREVEGEILQSTAGRYTVLLADGTEKSFTYGEIARVERTRATRHDPFKAGFEITGLGMGPRFSWERERGPVAALGVRGGFTVVPYDDYVYPMLWAAMAVDWLADSPVQIETTLGLQYSVYYPGVVAGAAARIAPAGRFVRMNVGLLAATDMFLYYPTVWPDISVSFVW